MTQKNRQTEIMKKLRIKAMLTALMAVMVFISGFCAYKIITIVQDYKASEREYSSIIDEAVEMPEVVDDKEPEAPQSKYLKVNHSKLKKKNSDYVGWIYIPGTNINYPVVKATDNDWYLIRSFEGSWSGSGSIFMDYENSRNWTDFHTIVYGHHMKNKTMFWALNQFRNSSFWDEHQTVEIYYENSVCIYRVFSFYKGIADDESYNMKFFSDQEKSDWIRQIQSMSMYKSKQDVMITDHILTLSTCVDATSADRWILHSVLSEVIDLSE